MVSASPAASQGVVARSSPRPPAPRSLLAIWCPRTSARSARSFAPPRPASRSLLPGGVDASWARVRAGQELRLARTRPSCCCQDRALAVGVGARLCMRSLCCASRSAVFVRPSAPWLGAFDVVGADIPHLQVGLKRKARRKHRHRRWRTARVPCRRYRLPVGFSSAASPRPAPMRTRA